MKMSKEGYGAGESAEELEFFVSYFQIFCWFKIIKRQIIKK